MTQWFKRDDFIGGASNALDSIDGANLVDGAFAVVTNGGFAYIYRLNATSGAAESSPDVIKPDTNAGLKRWILQEAIISDATTTTKGKVELATDAETVTGTSDAVVTTPGNITAKMSAPGPIGDNTPDEGTFDALTVTVSADMGGNRVQNVADPTDLADAVNLGTLLDEIGVSLNYWISNQILTTTLTDSEEVLLETPSSDPETLTTITFKSTVEDTPTPFTIKEGAILEVHYAADVTSTAGKHLEQLKFQLGYVDADGTSNFTQIGIDSDLSSVLTSIKTEFEAHIHVAADTTVPTGKRLWLKVIADATLSGGSYPEINFYFDTPEYHLTFGVAGSILGNFVQKAGDTMSGELSMADNTVSRPALQDYSEEVNDEGDTGGGAVAFDIEDGNVIEATVSTAETTFTFSNPSPSGKACSFTLILTNGGSQTVNWPASVDWEDGNAPMLTAAGVDVLTFMTVDGGTIWYGFLAGLDMK